MFKAIHLHTKNKHLKPVINFCTQVKFGIWCHISYHKISDAKKSNLSKTLKGLQLISLLISLCIFWINDYKMIIRCKELKNTYHKCPKPKVTSSNYLYCVINGPKTKNNERKAANPHINEAGKFQFCPPTLSLDQNQSTTCSCAKIASRDDQIQSTLKVKR